MQIKPFTVYNLVRKEKEIKSIIYDSFGHNVVAF